MRIPIINIPTCSGKQTLKIKEEAHEVLEAFANGESKDRVLEECLDTIQATLNLMAMIATEEEIQQASCGHMLKMRARKYELKDFVQINDSSHEEVGKGILNAGGVYKDGVLTYAGIELRIKG
jgi:hypothetical protein